MIPGLRYVDDFVSPDESIALLAAIDAAPWLDDLQRRVQHYGYRYDYRARAVVRDMYLGALPAWASSVIERVGAYFATPPDQLIVNEYEPGQGIAQHIDCIPCFGPVVASLSLGSSVQMDLSRGEAAQTILLESRSLLVLAGEARTEWRHGIRGRLSDSIEGTRVARSRRVSLTFRTVVLEPPS